MEALRLILWLLVLPFVYEEGRCGPHLLPGSKSAMP